MSELKTQTDAVVMGCGPNRWAKARVKNDFGVLITNLELRHRYDEDHHDKGGPWYLEPGQKSPEIDVGFWVGIAEGKDYWWVKFDSSGSTWTCKTNFYCFLTAEDANKTVVLRLYRDGDMGKMDVIPPTSRNCTVRLDTVS